MMDDDVNRKSINKLFFLKNKYSIKVVNAHF